MKFIPIIASLFLTAASIVLTLHIVEHSQKNQVNKSDYAELNHVKYGIFSVEAWKNQLLSAVKLEFDRLYESKGTEEEMRVHIATIMTKLIDEVVQKVKEENQKSTSGKIKQLFIDMFVDIEKLKQGVPEYTEAIINELKNPNTKTQVKTTVFNQLEEFAAKSKDVQEESKLKNIILSTGTDNIESARVKLGDSIERLHKKISKEALALVALNIANFFIFAMCRKTRNPFQFLLLVVSLTLLLWAGTATPMIDIEAKISELKFLLIGHPILFENQVFYFQSKSILDVFFIMINDPKLSMKSVGILVVMFSVFFPAFKLLSTLLYYFEIKNLKNNSLVRFFVFKSGKWSMADVMVVAIFMAYVGFNGIIGSQLDELSAYSDGMSIITTNGTQLQVGFFLFLVFVIITLLLSQLLSNQEDVQSRS